MKWIMLYDDWSTYNSDEHNWEDIPMTRVVKLTLQWPNGNKVICSGWDVFCMEKVGDAWKMTYWKDDDPDDPYYNKGQSRIFYSDESSVDTDYISKDNFVNSIPANCQKRGIWVSDSLAKEMGVL